MMKMNSIIHSVLVALCPAPAPGRPGFCRAVADACKFERKEAFPCTSSPGRVCVLSVKTAPVDNFYSASIPQTAEKTGTVDKFASA